MVKNFISFYSRYGKVGIFLMICFYTILNLFDKKYNIKIGKWSKPYSKDTDFRTVELSKVQSKESSFEVVNNEDLYPFL